MFHPPVERQRAAQTIKRSTQLLGTALICLSE
jgi:hypothetical protein